MFEHLETMDVGYVSVSGDAARCCGRCQHFRPGVDDGSSECQQSEQGSCFGQPVTSAGACNMFTA
jgi:hypothetical protein